MPESRMRRQIAEAELSDIVVYPNRRRMIGWIAIYSFPVLLAGPVVIGLMLLLVFSTNARNQVGSVILLMALFGSIMIMSAWPMLRLMAVIFSGEPILVVNHAGIRVRQIYASRAIFLPWEEVKAIYGSLGAPYTVFCIRPVHDQWLSAHLSLMERFARRLNNMSGTITLSQSMLDQPVEAILEQMQRQYKQELQLHKEQEQAAGMLPLEASERMMILYTSRWHLLAVAFFVCMALFPGLILVFVGPWQWSGVLISLLFLVGNTAAGSILAWKILRVPVLVVDDEGIASPRLLKNEKIKWEEIDAIYCGPGEKDVLIDASPSGIAAFLARRHKGQLVIPRSMDITIPQTVYTIPERMLPLPSASLLEQIKARFHNKLEYYRIETAVY